MEHIISQVHKSLVKKKKTLAVAESCTGGLVSGLLTQLSGSSRYLKLGIVAYSNQAKTSLLKVPAKLIAQKGAVSQEVADALAHNVRKLAKSDFGIAVTGIAGPTGGSAQKPIGTVFISVAGPQKAISQKFHFTGTRATIRRKAALASLCLLKRL